MGALEDKFLDLIFADFCIEVLYLCYSVDVDGDDDDDDDFNDVVMMMMTVVLMRMMIVMMMIYLKYQCTLCSLASSTRCCASSY